MTSNTLLLLVQSSAAMINLTGVFYFKKELKNPPKYVADTVLSLDRFTFMLLFNIDGKKCYFLLRIVS